MNKKIIAMSAAGIAVVALTGAVFADSTSTTGNSPQIKQHAHHPHNGPFQNKELITFLNLDSATLQKDLKAGQSLAEIAKAQGKNETDLTNFLVEQASKRIDQSVTSGKITKDKADQMKAKLPDGIKRMVEHKGGFHSKKNGRNKGNGGQLKIIASVIGIDQKELMAKIKAGESVAQIASEHNVNKQDLIDKLVQKDKERISQMVEKKWQQHKQNQKSASTNTDNK